MDINEEIKRVKVTAILMLIFILIITVVTLGILAFVMKAQCEQSLVNMHETCTETFIKIAGMNVTDIMQSYEYCGKLTESPYLQEIATTCQQCVDSGGK